MAESSDSSDKEITEDPESSSDEQGEELDINASSTESDDDGDDEQGEELDIDASSTGSDDDVDDEQGEGLDIDASSTESDNDVDDDENPSKTTKLRTRTDLAIENLLQKYNERQGKQLFIRFPKKLPTDESEFQEKVKSVSPLVVRGHKPRQNYARFCLVDFSSTEDRDKAFESIRAAIKNDETFHGIVVSLPRTEKKEFVQELVEKKRKSIEMKKTKQRLKRESKKALRSQNFTSSIVILNLPKSAAISEIRKDFSNAVDIQIKPGRGKFNGASVATITLPSTKDAREAVKRKVSLGNTELIIRFDTKKFLYKKKKVQKRKSKPTEVVDHSPTKKKRIV